ncbi:MAG TPA: alanine racemase [Acidimicrobiia bacterium]|nr:alanine racemase [Acidimicrobiia bacterium]
MRPSWVEVDLEAVRHNVRALAGVIAPAMLCAVVKADGYGHGDVPVAEAAVDAGAAWLAVALLEEGVRLREAGVDAPILLLSEPPLTDAPEVVRWNLTPTVYRADFVRALRAAGAERVQVKVDTGMHRVGVAPPALPHLVEVCRAAGVTVDAIWTHFAVSEEVGDFTIAQTAAFDEAVAGMDIPMTHLANTAGGILYPEARRDMVRIGIGIYGIHPGPATRARVGLQPAMRIVSRVGYVQRLAAGDRPSYGRRRALDGDSNVVTVPIGYADGFPRGLSDRGQVLVGGRRHPLAGTVTMDQIVVDVGVMAVEVGDEVVLIGRQGDEEITADEWAGLLGTIAYEVVCQIGPRLPRRYS